MASLDDLFDSLEMSLDGDIDEVSLANKFSETQGSFYNDLSKAAEAQEAALLVARSKPKPPKASTAAPVQNVKAPTVVSSPPPASTPAPTPLAPSSTEKPPVSLARKPSLGRMPEPAAVTTAPPPVAPTAAAATTKTPPAVNHSRKPSIGKAPEPAAVTTSPPAERPQGSFRAAPAVSKSGASENSVNTPVTSTSTPTPTSSASTSATSTRPPVAHARKPSLGKLAEPLAVTTAPPPVNLARKPSLGKNPELLPPSSAPPPSPMRQNLASSTPVTAAALATLPVVNKQAKPKPAGVTKGTCCEPGCACSDFQKHPFYQSETCNNCFHEKSKH